MKLTNFWAPVQKWGSKVMSLWNPSEKNGERYTPDFGEDHPDVFHHPSGLVHADQLYSLENARKWGLIYWEGTSSQPHHNWRGFTGGENKVAPYDANDPGTWGIIPSKTDAPIVELRLVGPRYIDGDFNVDSSAKFNANALRAKALEPYRGGSKQLALSKALGTFGDGSPTSNADGWYSVCVAIDCAYQRNWYETRRGKFSWSDLGRIPNTPDMKQHIFCNEYRAGFP